MPAQKNENKRTLTVFSLVALVLLFAANIVILRTEIVNSVLFAEWLPSVPGSREQRVGGHVWVLSREPTAAVEVQDEHPIRELMHKAQYQFEQYDRDRSRSFKETVTKYRSRYGRHPPPGFKEVCYSTTHRNKPTDQRLTGLSVVQIRA